MILRASKIILNRAVSQPFSSRESLRNIFCKPLILAVKRTINGTFIFDIVHKMEQKYNRNVKPLIVIANINKVTMIALSLHIKKKKINTESFQQPN